jgi:hypothetical protein
VAKNVLAFRATNEFYYEANTVWRSMQCYRFFWGLSSKLMLTPSVTFSNHHGEMLPAGFISDDGNSGLHTHGTSKGNPYPYRFENVWLNAKYRFLSKDARNEHFRMAAYADLAVGNLPHDEAEPSFMGDNSGAGGGVVATYLKNKFAVSINSGIILPFAYTEDETSIEIQYGRAYTYSLSVGYLLLPFKYKNYDQINVNLYVELLGKSYDEPALKYNGQDALVSNVPAFESGSNTEIRPALQFIIRSNTRVDLSFSKLLSGTTYVRALPAYYLNLQHYFYF